VPRPPQRRYLSLSFSIETSVPVPVVQMALFSLGCRVPADPHKADRNETLATRRSGRCYSYQCRNHLLLRPPLCQEEGQGHMIYPDQISAFPPRSRRSISEVHSMNLIVAVVALAIGTSPRPLLGCTTLPAFDSKSALADNSLSSHIFLSREYIDQKRWRLIPDGASAKTWKGYMGGVQEI